MLDQTTKAVSCRNKILFLAVTYFLLAIYAGLHVRDLTMSPLGLLWLALMLAGGIFAALGIRQFAELVLPTSQSPWYIRPHAFLFGVFMIVVINALYSKFADDIIATIFGHTLPPLPGRLFSITAAELLGIVIINWPRSQQTHQDRHKVPSTPEIESRGDYTLKPKSMSKPFDSRKEL